MFFYKNKIVQNPRPEDKFTKTLGIHAFFHKTVSSSPDGTLALAIRPKSNMFLRI